MKIFCTDVRLGISQPFLLQEQAGVVLGTLFKRDGGAPVACPTVFDVEETARITRSEGRRLITSYWGRYIAFVHDPASDRKWILRDPSGGLPCLCTIHDGVRIYFSYMEDCLSLRLPGFSINWQYMAAHAVARLVDTRATAFDEVSEVAAGECMEVCGDRTSHEVYWQPLRIASSNLIEGAQQAAGSLRETVRSCVHSWASNYSSIIHNLSGGLDSSIVLACLRDAPNRPRVHCLNYRSDGSDGDERYFARLTAKHLGYELIEMTRQSEGKLREATAFARSARPAIPLIGYEALRTEARVAHTLGAHAVFGGVGGDQVFYQNPALLTVADYVCRRGIRGPLFQIALDVARTHRMSVWAVLRRAITAALIRRDRHPWDTAEIWRHRTLVSKDVLDAFRNDRQYLHPWFSSAVDAPPGKLNQIFSLSSPAQYYDYMGRTDDIDRVEPLLSQPIMELCLRIPTYVLMSDGWDRIVARRAFTPDLPREIVKRRSKGGLEEYVQEILSDNSEYIRETLLDGILVSKRILDRSKLLEVLSARPTNVFGGLAEIVDHLSAEVWLRNWSLGKHQAAA